MALTFFKDLTAVRTTEQARRVLPEPPRPGRSTRFFLSGPSSARAVVGFLALLAGLLSLWSTARGPGISVDSVYYASTAHSYATSGRLTQFDGSAITMWPPGLPLLLGTVERLGLAPQMLTRIVDAFAVAVAVILTYLLGRLVLGSRSTACLIATVVASSAGTTRVFSMLWTEPLFTALTLGVLVVLTTVVQHDHLSFLSAAGVASMICAASALRFTGLVLIPIAALVALGVGQLPLWKALVRSLVMAASASVVLVAIAVRNVMLDSGPLGTRGGEGEPLVRVVAQGVRTLGRYVLPIQTKTLFFNSLTVSIGLLLCVLILLGVWSVARVRNVVATPVVLFTVLWWVVLVYAGSTTVVDSLDDRLTAPVFASTTITLALGLRWLGQASTRRSLVTRRTTQVGTAILVATAVIAGLGGSIGYAASSARDGIGYNDVASTRSALAHALAGLPKDALVSSNDVPRAFWLSGHYGVQPYSPARVPVRGSYVVLFTGIGGGSPPQPASASGLLVRPLVTDDQGTLYRVG